MMLLPVDPVMSLIVVAGVFIYYAIKSIDTSPPKDDESDHEFIERIFRENSPDYRRYQRWLEEHQQPEP